MFFISYDACKRCFCCLKANKASHLTSLFNAVVKKKKDMATDLDCDI